MGLFSKPVKTYAEEAAETIKKAVTDNAAETIDIGGAIAEIGIFGAILLSVFGSKGKKTPKNPDCQQITINNYYYKEDKNHENRR